MTRQTCAKAGVATPFKLLDGITEENAVAVAKDIFEKGGIRAALNGPNIAHYILDKNIDKIRDYIGTNPDNKYSSKVFTALTGIKLQRTIRERCAQLDEWAGITPDIRGAINIRKMEAKRIADMQSDLRMHWDDLARLKIDDSSGSEITVDQFIIQKLKEGYTAIGVSEKRVGLVNKEVLDGKRDDIPMFITLKSANFRRFCKLVATIDPVNFDALKVLTDAGRLTTPVVPDSVSVRQRM
jgi:hypothetical protein